MSIVTLLPRAIRREFARISATDLVLENLGDGYALLKGEPAESLRWQGKAREILDRLRGLPTGAGSDAVIAAFRE